MDDFEKKSFLDNNSEQKSNNQDQSKKYSDKISEFTLSEYCEIEVPKLIRKLYRILSKDYLKIRGKNGHSCYDYDNLDNAIRNKQQEIQQEINSQKQSLCDYEYQIDDNNRTIKENELIQNELIPNEEKMIGKQILNLDLQINQKTNSEKLTDDEQLLFDFFVVENKIDVNSNDIVTLSKEMQELRIGNRKLYDEIGRIINIHVLIYAPLYKNLCMEKIKNGNLKELKKFLTEKSVDILSQNNEKFSEKYSNYEYLSDKLDDQEIFYKKLDGEKKNLKKQKNLLKKKIEELKSRLSTKELKNIKNRTKAIFQEKVLNAQLNSDQIKEIQFQKISLGHDLWLDQLISEETKQSSIQAQTDINQCDQQIDKTNQDIQGASKELNELDQINSEKIITDLLEVLKSYYLNILKPVFNELLDTDLTLKKYYHLHQDNSQLSENEDFIEFTKQQKDLLSIKNFRNGINYKYQILKEIDNYCLNIIKDNLIVSAHLQKDYIQNQSKIEKIRKLNDRLDEIFICHTNFYIEKKPANDGKDENPMGKLAEFSYVANLCRELEFVQEKNFTCYIAPTDNDLFLATDIVLSRENINNKSQTEQSQIFYPLQITCINKGQDNSDYGEKICQSWRKGVPVISIGRHIDLKRAFFKNQFGFVNHLHNEIKYQIKMFTKLLINPSSLEQKNANINSIFVKPEIKDILYRRLIELDTLLENSKKSYPPQSINERYCSNNSSI